jgi:hypothetical protein
VPQSRHPRGRSGNTVPANPFFFAACQGGCAPDGRIVREVETPCGDPKNGERKDTNAPDGADRQATVCRFRQSLRFSKVSYTYRSGVGSHWRDLPYQRKTTRRSTLRPQANPFCPARVPKFASPVRDSPHGRRRRPQRLFCGSPKENEDGP